MQRDVRYSTRGNNIDLTTTARRLSSNIVNKPACGLFLPPYLQAFAAGDMYFWTPGKHKIKQALSSPLKAFVVAVEQQMVRLDVRSMASFPHTMSVLTDAFMIHDTLPGSCRAVKACACAIIWTFKLRVLIRRGGGQKKQQAHKLQTTGRQETPS